MKTIPKPRRRDLYALLPKDAFTREDGDDDRQFYAEPRLKAHLDRVALDTVERLIGSLVVESDPAILDLMASWDSHVPASLRPARLVGLGLNRAELDRNEALTERVVHDLNVDPSLPFGDETFDVVLNVVSVDYLVRPVEVFREIARVLKPGGLCLVVFSDRMFSTKAVKIWRESGEHERVWLVEDYLQQTQGQLQPPLSFASLGKPRPPDDPYAEAGVPSDPIYAVYADKVGGEADRPRPELDSEIGVRFDEAELAERKAEVGATLRCPYCDEPLQKFDVLPSPFLEWDNEFVYVCYNNQCPYLCSGWEVMRQQGNLGFSYRLMYDPLRDRCHPTPTANVYGQLSKVSIPRG